MSESFTETSYESYPKRVIGSIVVSIISIFFIYLVFILYIHIEHYAKLKQLGLSEAGRKVIAANCVLVNQDHHGKVVHMIGDLKSRQTIQEPIFRFRFKALKVVRKVEMYQWEEDVSTTETVMLGGDSVKRKTYSYDKVWSDELIDSSDFRKKKYKNPKSFKIEHDEFYVNNAYAGKFHFEPISKLNGQFAKDVIEKLLTELT